VEDELLKVVAGLFSRQFFRSTHRAEAIRGDGEISRRRAKTSATTAESTRCKRMKIVVSTLPFSQRAITCHGAFTALLTKDIPAITFW
jgi:hypothetical protein